MIIKSIDLQNFRNYETEKIEFDENTNISTEIMHRERLIFLRQYFYQVHQKAIKEVRTQR